MPTNAAKPRLTTTTARPRALAGLRNDERGTQLTVGTPRNGPNSFPTAFESPPDPLEDQNQSKRRSPPHSHTDATTTIE